MESNWIKVHEQTVKSESSTFNFWSGINVWIERPHIINRKLLAVEVLEIWMISGKDTFSMEDILFELLALYEVSMRDIEAVFKNEYFHIKKITSYKQEIPECEKSENSAIFIFRKLLPRNLDKFHEVLEVIAIATNCVTFYPKKTDVQASHITPAFPYRIVCKDNLISLEVCRTENQDNVNVEQSELWLKTSVFPKVVKWSQNLPDNAILPSLTLVSAKKFNSYYQFLKRKYGKKYIEMWPECSDPLKYVYEDLSIAAYLMTTWEQERERLNLSKKQTFVDLGCGNGLLVSILSSEGYKGIGIDVRKRKIWDLYGSSTVLIEKAVEPSDQLLFPEYDWIIGNHSDELTPWIPVIAARSSYNMRVFLLPCCCYTFNGKYERHFPGNTQYQSYLKFLQELCKTMGFDVQQDKLRIPSTKRICIVCQSRTYEKCDEAEIDALRSEFIQYHSKRYTCSSVCLQAGNSRIQAENKVAISKSNHWVRDFIPREKIENVRNCTNLDKIFLEETVIAVAEILLKTENYVHIQRDTNTISWNSGGQISIEDLAISLDSKILKGMKSQCGGLQTFLRNHKNVFQVRNGKIQLQIPRKDFLLCDESLRKKHKGSKDKKNFHERKCYFHHHHPQGCPLLANECNFLH